MSNVISGEGELPIQGRSREEMMASEAAVTKFTIEIQHDTAALLERIVEEILDIIASLFDDLVEKFQFLHSLVSEYHATLLEFSTGILMVNWIVCNPLFLSLVESFSPPTSEINSTLALPSRLLFKFMGVLNVAIVDLDSIVNHYHGENITSITRDETDVADGGMSSLTDFTFIGNKMLSFISPTVMMIVGPLTVMTLTCIIADNKYYLFATLFAPMVDRILSSMQSILAIITPNYQGYQHRMIPDDGETYDGVLWGMLVLFCLESILVGSIVVLMVLVSLSLTVLASMPTILSPSDNPEILEQTSKILFGFLFSWVTCVVTTNVLRMMLYQTIDNDG